MCITIVYNTLSLCNHIQVMTKSITIVFLVIILFLRHNKRGERINFTSIFLKYIININKYISEVSVQLDFIFTVKSFTHWDASGSHLSHCL